MPDSLYKARRGYQAALTAAVRARSKSHPEGYGYVDYWIGRLEFGIGYLDTVEAVRQAAIAEEAKNRDETRKNAKLALDKSKKAIDAYARIARDQSDRGAIATLVEYVYRPLKKKVDELN